MIDFSYIIVNFRTPKLTLDAVRSIISHEKKSSFEIIVIENGSEDNSARFLSKYLPKSVKLIISDENLGFGQANNLGSQKAKGRFFIIFNSDAYQINQILPKISQIFTSNPQISILGTKIVYPNYKLQPSHGSLPGIFSVFFWMFFIDDLPVIRLFIPSVHKRAAFFYRKTAQTGWVTGAVMVFKRGVYRKLNGFNPKIFLYAEDIDICLRAKKNRYKVFFTHKVSVVHIGQQSSKGRPDKALINEIKGLMYVSKLNFNPLKHVIIKLLFTSGALLRLLIFGIILKNTQRRNIYSEILKVIW